LAPLLLKWFDSHQRNLPWRESRDPYRIWISEVMLQQTVAATVVPFFERFTKRFPNVKSLAEAETDEVLHLWQGLGYYRRARMLHQAARQLVSLGFEKLPDDPKVVGELPGLGRYTTNAILSQAFERRVPILEANTFRLLARLFGLLDDPRTKPSEAWLWEAAEAILPEDRPGDFNQALMELGSQICSVNSPSCLICPIHAMCVTNLAGLQSTIPNTTPKAAPTPINELCVGLENEKGEWLVLRRGMEGRWARMWEFPRVQILEKESAQDAASRAAKELVGFTIQNPRKQTQLRHAVTRFKVTLELWTAKTKETGPKLDPAIHSEFLWIKPADFTTLATATPQRKLMAWVLANLS